MQLMEFHQDMEACGGRWGNEIPIITGFFQRSLGHDSRMKLKVLLWMEEKALESGGGFLRYRRVYILKVPAGAMNHYNQTQKE